MSRKRIYHTDEERRQARIIYLRRWRKRKLGGKIKQKVKTMFEPCMFDGNEQAAELARRNNELLTMKTWRVSC